MAKIKDLLQEEMPREKLIKNGPLSLTETELLAIILRTGTKHKNVIELSREIITHFSINLVSRKTFEELLMFKGIKKAKACQIVALFELARRLSLKRWKNKKTKIKNPLDIYKYCKADFQDEKTEKIIIIFVDTKNQIIKKELLFQGTLNSSNIDIRVLIKKTLIYDAAGFFLIHNHPSGDINPSKKDIEITQKIKQITSSLNIKLLDHIIIGDTYFSFFDKNLL